MSVSVQFTVDPLSPVSGPAARLSFSGPHPNQDQSVPAADFAPANIPELCREESRNAASSIVSESKVDDSLPAVRSVSADAIEKKGNPSEKDMSIPVVPPSPSPNPITTIAASSDTPVARPAASASLFSHMYKIDNIVPDFLWISGVGASKERQVLQQLQISHIINCTNECANRFPTTFEYRRVEVSDDISQGDAIYAAFEECSNLLDRLQKDGKRVLVHCAAGQSRSATIALAYLIKHQTMSLRTAYRYLKDRRPVTRPNTAFFESLLRWEREIRGDNSCTIEEYKSRRL